MLDQGHLDALIENGHGRYQRENLKMQKAKNNFCKGYNFTMDNRFLDADTPEIDPQYDALGYTHFTKEVAKTIAKINADDGFVIAITGEWGSGKTTTLNYVEHFLTNESDELSLSKSDIPLILHFNPWLFSGHQDIVFQFFSQIYSEFKQKKIDFETLQPIFEKLFEFGSLLATISTPAGFLIGSSFALLKGLAKKEEEKTIDKTLKLRRELVSLLKNQNKTVLVVIDDVDRLTANEIQELFRALKAVASFPKMIYLLAYDTEVVVEAFENQTIGGVINKGKGREYLEKIVQLSLSLPPPKPTSLNAFMRKTVGEAIGPFDDIYYDVAHWTWTNEGGMSHFINTPRKVKRLANSLKILYPPVKNEVNVVDFIALEVLKQNVPSIYQKIRDNPHILLDDKAFFFGYTLKKPEELQKKFYAEFLESISSENRDPVIRIIINLFPDSRQYLDPELNHFHFDKKEIQRARICSTLENFTRYFRFELSEDDFSNHEILWLLSVEWNHDVLLSYLLEQFENKSSNGISRLSPLLGKLTLFVDNSTPKPFIQVMLKSLFNLHDRVLTNSDNSPQMFGPQNIISRIKHLIYWLLELLPPEVKSEELTAAFQEGTSIPILSEILARVSRENGRYGEKATSYPLVSSDTLKSLERIWLQKIRNLSMDPEKFFASPDLHALIFVWAKIPGCESEVKAYVQKFMQNDKLIIFSIIQARDSDYLYPIQPTSLSPLVEAVVFKNRVENILQSSTDLNENDRIQLTDFINKN
jgi:predicted KAP-like P-loop ATPase